MKAVLLASAFFAVTTVTTVTAAAFVLGTTLATTPTAAQITSTTSATILNKNNVNNKSVNSNTCGVTSTSTTALQSSSSVQTVSTKPIEGMKPGTSGLRKKVNVWKGKTYLENFIQSLLDTIESKQSVSSMKGDENSIIVAGDGRYYNSNAIQTICPMIAANIASRSTTTTTIYIPQNGIMSTPAVSACIRSMSECYGAIVLTASHNPGGPDEDFGIKYNLDLGQPAGEDFTDELYERSLKIETYKTLESSPSIDLSADVGTVYKLTDSCSVQIIDPFETYVSVLKQCFDFDKLRSMIQSRSKDFSVVFDGMHGAGGPFARRILVEELGLDESVLLRCDPRPDFGGCHPDPNLSYAAELVKRMGLKPDGSADPDVDLSTVPTLGAANDGDGDRNLIAGAGCFVTPSDSLAMICDNWEAIPHFANAGGPKGVARSMPSSAALDVVAKARGIPFFSTPTGWKFFGNLMSSKELFDKKDYTPFLCGEESFGTGSDHIREKDGLWAMLAWLSILSHANEATPVDAPLVSVNDIVRKHWAKYGRHFYCRYDYEGVDSDAANKVVDGIRDNFVSGNVSEASVDGSGIKLIGAEEFGYTDPVDGSQTSNQGLILSFEYSNGDTARVVFRLSGTGSSGATIRMYLEKYEPDVTKHDQAAPSALKSLADTAIALVHMQDLTGRDAPTVIT